MTSHVPVEVSSAKLKCETFSKQSRLEMRDAEFTLRALWLRLQEQCRDISLLNQPQNCNEEVTIQRMIVGFRLHEGPHTGDMGETVLSMSSQLLGMLSSLFFICRYILPPRTNHFSRGGGLSQHRSQVHS